MKRTTLAPIVVTSRSRRIVGGEAGDLTSAEEVWAARTTDGAWELVREDVPGTPWQVVRTADKRSGGSYSTLRAARVAIASGTATFEANRCPACAGSGHAYEWREGAEHNRGFVAWEKSNGVVRYKHRVGACPCCAGAGRVAA